MAVDKSTVARIAKLAHIRVSEDESEALTGELSNILDWVEQLGELDTANVPPMTSVVAMKLGMRADLVDDGACPEDIVRNAPEAAHGFFTVPKVIE